MKREAIEAYEATEQRASKTVRTAILDLLKQYEGQSALSARLADELTNLFVTRLSEAAEYLTPAQPKVSATEASLAEENKQMRALIHTLTRPTDG